MKKHTKQILATLAILAVVAAPFSASGAEQAKAPAGASNVPADYKGKPYQGVMLEIPGIIQAEAYDVAPNNAPGITFGDQQIPKKTPLRVTEDSVGIGKFGQGHVTIKNEPEAPEQVYVGWTSPGHWWKYTVHVKEAGTYLIGTHIAAGRPGAKLSISFSPQITTGPLDIPTTAGFVPGVEVYHVWEKLDHLAEVKLPAGDCVMTVKVEAVGGMNIDYLSFTKK